MFTGVQLMAFNAEKIAEDLRAALEISWRVVAETPKVLELQISGAPLRIGEDSRSLPWVQGTVILDFHVADLAATLERFKRSGHTQNSGIRNLGGVRYATVEMGSGIQVRLAQSGQTLSQPVAANTPRLATAFAAPQAVRGRV